MYKFLMYSTPGVRGKQKQIETHIYPFVPLLNENRYIQFDDQDLTIKLHN